MKTLSLPYEQYFRWLLTVVLCCVMNHTASLAQVFQNTLTLSSTDEYCAGLSSDAASSFYISVGNTNSGGTNRVLLTKYNAATGNVIWTRTINQPGAITSWYATDIQASHTTLVSETNPPLPPISNAPATAATIAVPTANSSYYISGYTNTTTCTGTSTVRRMVLYKVDANGNFVWTRSNFVGGCTYDETGVSVETAPNGDVFIVGSARNTSNNRNHVSVSRVRANGNLVWQRRYLTSNTASYSYVPRQSITTREPVNTTNTSFATGIAVTGEFRNTAVATSVFRGFVMRIAADGTELWRVGHFLPGSTISSGQDIIIDPTSSNFTVVGHVNSATTANVRSLFWQVSPLGGHVLSQIYNQSNQAPNYAQSIVPSRNAGNFVVAGSVNLSTVVGAATADTYLMELSPAGIPWWFHYYTRTTPRYAATESVVGSPMGYYISTNTTRNNTADGHVIAVDAAGMLPSASPDDCVEKSSQVVVQITGDTQIQVKAQTATTAIAAITTQATSINPTEDICKPTPCPQCTSFTATIGDCTQDAATGAWVRPVSFGLNCAIPTSATGTMTWDFGDGSAPYTGSLVSITHNYAPGTYTVCAYGNIMINGLSCPFQICQTIVVEPCALPCPECTSFSYTTSCVPNSAGTLVPQATFTLNCTPSANIVSGNIWWDFGDINTGYYPYNTATHIYASPGTYTVCAHAAQLVLDNGQICELDYVICQEVVIPPCQNPCPTCTSFTPNIGNCQQTATGTWYRQVGFSLDCPAPTGSTISMNWNFGDGSPVVNYNSWVSPVHNYAPGTYNVCTWGTITLADGTQCPFEFCQTVVVPPCQTCPNCNSFTAYIGDCQQTATGAWYRQVGFSLNCPIPAGSTINMTWSFGDGSANANFTNWVSPVHNYAPGTYSVCAWGVVTLADGTQCPFDHCQTIIVPACPDTPCPSCTSLNYQVNCQQVAGATTLVPVATFGLACQFPTGTTFNNTWTFGDGTSQTTTTPTTTHAYPTSGGTYTVCVNGSAVLSNGLICQYSICETIIIPACSNNPCPSCVVNTQVSCCFNSAGAVVQYGTFGLACPFTSALPVTWSVNGTQISSTTVGTTVTYQFPSSGSYHVCAIVSNPTTGQVCDYCSTVEVTASSCPSPIPNCANVNPTTKTDQTALVSSLNISPNPFRSQTNIEYTLEKANQVTIQVYNVMGQMVSSLANNQHQEAGTYLVTFDASTLPTGTYFCTFVTADGISQTQRMVLTK